MHILEDPSELSARAQDFLRRTGRRGRPSRFGLPIELWQVHDHAGKLVPAPMDLIIRCEGFEQRFGGLRYEVRQSRVVDGNRYETARGWEYDHLGVKTRAWQDHGTGGWYFEWTGERVSKPSPALAPYRRQCGHRRRWRQSLPPHRTVHPAPDRIACPHRHRGDVEAMAPGQSHGLGRHTPRRPRGSTRSFMEFLAVAAVGHRCRHGVRHLGSEEFAPLDARLVPRGSRSPPGAGGPGRTAARDDDQSDTVTGGGTSSRRRRLWDQRTHVTSPRRRARARAAWACRPSLRLAAAAAPCQAKAKAKAKRWSTP